MDCHFLIFVGLTLFTFAATKSSSNCGDEIIDKCRLNCTHGLATDEKGCVICQCLGTPPLCNPQCRKYCPFGFRYDSQGCQTCICKTEPDDICGRGCQTYCPQGRNIDEKGCPMCGCKTLEITVDTMKTCPEIACGNVCQYGRKYDLNGCATCECLEQEGIKRDKGFGSGHTADEAFNDELNLNTAFDDTLPGNAVFIKNRGEGKDAIGKDLSKAQKDDCKPLCKNLCPYGRVFDAHGCATCECKPAPSRGNCGPVCKNHCPYGRFEDTNRCPTCLCKPPGFDINGNATTQATTKATKEEPKTTMANYGRCPRVLCHNFCLFGRVKDSEGCSTCSCQRMNRLPWFGCRGFLCHYFKLLRPSTCTLVSCPEFCFFGHVYENGCKTCRCKHPFGFTRFA